MTAKITGLLRAMSVYVAVGTLGLAYSTAALALSETGKGPKLLSDGVIVVDISSGQVLYAKNAGVERPIASITKLMTAMVTLDAKLPMGQKIRVTQEDVDRLRNSHSRLRVGTVHTRRELLQLALMSSENRAAAALARTYPRGRHAFYAKMNAKARLLGMKHTRFVEATGLDSDNVSTAEDLVQLVSAGFTYPLIRAITTTTSYEVRQKRVVKYRNTNPLVRNDDWQIGLSKTGYIKPAGHCVAMQAQIGDRPLVIVLLDAAARYSIIADSNRIKNWIEASAETNTLAVQEQEDVTGYNVAELF
ncbi:MAG: D-alanyl-D-alanine endopeptidase [Gammaproteobacteria bacterium]|nr:D-alanyl-D-alanine endopeptidase [Gammaproteobacteria bacterium]